MESTWEGLRRTAGGTLTCIQAVGSTRGRFGPPATLLQTMRIPTMNRALIDTGEVMRRSYREARREMMSKDSRYLTKVHGYSKKHKQYEIEEAEFWNEFEELFSN